MNAIKYAFKDCRALLAGAALLAALPVLGQTTNRPSGKPDFSAFKLITDRNIFDPNRRGSTSSSRPRETRRSSRVEYVTLVGTMSYDEKGPLAFFDGTSSQYRKVLKPLEVIAGYKITDVGTSFVKLSSGTNEIDLPVGMQLRREDEGAWHVAEPAYSSMETRTESSRSSRSSQFSRGSQPGVPPPFPLPPSEGEPPIVVLDPNSQPVVVDMQEPNDTNAPQPEPAPGGSPDSVLQRLMQQRAQELNR